MGEDRAFRVAGGSRRVTDERGIVGGGVAPGCGYVGAAQRVKVIDALHGSGGVDEIADSRQVGIHHQHARPGIGHHIGHFGGGETSVHRHDHCAELPCGHADFTPLRAVPREYRDAITMGDATLSKASSQSVGARVEFGP